MPEASNNIVDIEGIFHKYKHKIYRLALGVAKDTKEAEDIVQDVFLKIIKNIDAFKGRSSLSTWIYRIAYNEALMHLRIKKKLGRAGYSDYKGSQTTNKEAGLYVSWPALPDKEAEHHELKAIIDRALGVMPIKYRMVLLLRTIEGLPVKETAVILGLKENSVKSRLHRARFIIHKELLNYTKGHQTKPSKKEDESCGISVGFIYDYIEGDLDKKKQSDFQKHIADCNECNIFLDTYTKAIAITNALQCSDIPKALQEKIKTFITKAG